MHPGRLHILLVEDNPDHAELACLAIQSCKAAHEIHHVLDGESALAFVRGCPQSGQPCPDLVLVDIRLPRLNGLEVLRHLKQDPQTARIPVAVLTTSAADTDTDAATQSNADGYLVKPMSSQDFSGLLENLHLTGTES